MVSVFGQNQRKSITDTVFQLDQAIVKETIKKKVNLLNLDVPLKTLPMTVTTLSSDVLERKNILNLEDAVRFLPGIPVSPLQHFTAFRRDIDFLPGIIFERKLINRKFFSQITERNPLIQPV